MEENKFNKNVLLLKDVEKVIIADKSNIEILNDKYVIDTLNYYGKSNDWKDILAQNPRGSYYIKEASLAKDNKDFLICQVVELMNKGPYIGCHKTSFKLKWFIRKGMFYKTCIFLVDRCLVDNFIKQHNLSQSRKLIKQMVEINQAISDKGKAKERKRR